MTAPSAKTWVEEHFPAAKDHAKAALIMAFGAGVDAGLAEGQEIIEEMAADLRRRIAVQDLPPEQFRVKP